MCRKHDSYTCRVVFPKFVGNIPTLLDFVRKIPTHVKVLAIIHTCVRIIPTCVGIILTCVGIVPTLVGIIPTLQENVIYFVNM